MITKSLFIVQPLVRRYLKGWLQLATSIPDPELRRQALMSIESKAFHCEGGSILGLLAGARHEEAIRFIVAYQTISDYLDNLCDRSTSFDPEDFTSLHQAMRHALNPQARMTDYYRLRPNQDDGGYLTALIKTCQEVLTAIPHYPQIASTIQEMADYYCDLQVHKHVKKEERICRLQEWFERHRPGLPPMSWFEFAACTGSTLGIFCLVSHAFCQDFSRELAEKIKKAYFPWVQGLHILLDYLIDQEEDRLGGDLNFCSFYSTHEEMTSRLIHFYRQAQFSVSSLPNSRFHSFIIQGLLATYLADRKVTRQTQVRHLAIKMLREGGGESIFLYLHCFIYRRIQFGSTKG